MEPRPHDDYIPPDEQAAAWIEGETDERPTFETDEEKRQAVDELVHLLMLYGIEDPMSVDPSDVDYSHVEEEDREVVERALAWYLELTDELETSDVPPSAVDRIAESLHETPHASFLDIPLEELTHPDDMFTD